MFQTLFVEILLAEPERIREISDEMPTESAEWIRRRLETGMPIYPWGLGTIDAVGAWWRESTPTMCCARVPDEIFDRLRGKSVGGGLGKGYESYREAWQDILRVLFEIPPATPA